MKDGVYLREWATRKGRKQAWYVVRGGWALDLKTATERPLEWWTPLNGAWTWVRELGGLAKGPEAL